MKFAAILLMVFACTKSVPPPSDAVTPPATASGVAMPETKPPALAAAGPRVTFPDGFVVGVEVVADDELRAQGLMYRDHLEPGAGMLFVFPEDGDYPFWMKNTRIPLDMIWIDATQKVAAVKFHVPPCVIADCPSYPPNAVARYVLEVGGGVAEQHGIKAGDQLRFAQTEGIVAR